MYRLLIVISLLLFTEVSPAQDAHIDTLRNQFYQLNDSGRYNEALGIANKITAYWQGKDESDSVAYYQNRHIATLIKVGSFAEALEESGVLTDTLEANLPLPDFMGSVYYTRGQCLLYNSQFEQATDAFNACIAFEEMQAIPDTNNIASATEWKGVVCYYLDSLPKAQSLAEEALKLRYAVADSSSMDVAYTLNTLGIIYGGRGMMAKTMATREETYRIFKLHLPADHPQLLYTAMNLSNTKADMGEIYEALSLLETAIAGNKKNGNTYDLMMQYYDLGSLYEYSLQDYEHGLIFYLKSLHLADSILPKPHALRATIYDGIAGAYLGKKKYLKADSCFRLALTEGKKLKNGSLKDLGRTTCNLGGVTSILGDTVSAINFFNQAVEYYTASVGENDPYTANARNQLGDYDWIYGKHEKALKTFRNSLRIYTKSFTTRNSYTLNTTIKLAECFDEINEPDSTSTYLKKAWEGVCDTKNVPIDLQKLSDYPIVFVDLSVLDLIESNLDILLKNKEFIGNNNNAEGIQLIKSMDNLMVKLWPMLNFDSETSSVLPQIKRIYRKGVFLACLNNSDDNHVRMLYLNSLEQSQSASIRSALQNRNAMHYANVPDSIVEKDQRLREKLRFVLANENDEDERNDENAKNLRFETFNQWRNFQKQLQEQYPDWYSARYAPKMPNLAEVQNKLARANASLIAYFVGDTSMVILHVEGGQFKSTAASLPPAWRDSVRTYRSLTEQRAAPGRLAPLSYYLYTLFWKPIEGNIKAQVMLIPDGTLNFLNFETLISTLPKSEEYADWDWLIKKHTFLYRNSLPGKEKPAKIEKNEVLALAPGFSDDLKAKYLQLDSTDADTTFTNWVQTPWSVALAEELEPKGKVFVGINATKEAFRENATHAEILHFGTHAQLNDAKPLNSYLALTPQPGDSDGGYLHAYELYDQPLNAQLAVLTACETGMGQYREGDGVISLAHAFQYAGCPNVVYSLWQIDDKQSTWLMKQFYAQMDEGQTFSSALRQAKLDYINQHSGELNAPYYWGGVVLTGDDGKLTSTKNLSGKYWWIMLFIIPVIIVAARRKRKQKLV